MISVYSGGIARDLFFLLTACLLAAVAGVAVNFFRNPPLPLLYENPAQRLAASVERLGGHAFAMPAEVSYGSVTLLDVRRFLANEDGILIDARSEIAFQVGHIPGAVNLPRVNFEEVLKADPAFWSRAALRPVIVYCSDSYCDDSGLVASALLKLGFSNVQVFPDGWEAWLEAGLPESTLP